MYRVSNKSVSIQGYRGNKKVFEHTIKNRLLDNYLDYIIWNMLPSSIGDVLFPKFATNTGVFVPMERAYLAFDTIQTIADNATSMTYDIDSETLVPDDIEESISNNGKLTRINFLFDTSGIGAGSTFTGIGFGRDDGTPNDYLLAFLNLTNANIDIVSGVDYRYVRVDEIITNEKLVSGTTADYLAGYRNDKLYSIKFASNLNGQGEYSTEYLVGDLTFNYVSAGKVSVSGFENYFVNDSMYPREDLFPDTDIYPLQFEKYRSVIFTYDGSQSGERIETYINLEDLDVSYDGTTIGINLICERGE